MKSRIDRLDVDSMPWAPTPTPGIFERILNVDAKTGARTLILKSLPRHKRDLTDRRPQVHPVDEEFYCLSGDFTLEGDIWFRGDCYAFYPSHLVHGHDVDVPGGYEIYLRNSGPISTERIGQPRANALYFSEERLAPSVNITLADAGAQLSEMRSRQVVSVIGLRPASPCEGGTFILNVPRGMRVTAELSSEEKTLEIFVLSGCVETGDRINLPARHYSCRTSSGAIELNGIETISSLLINYSCADTLRQFMRHATAAVAANALRSSG